MSQDMRISSTSLITPSGNDNALPLDLIGPAGGL